MNQMERQSLKHAADWLRYSKSPEYKMDASIDKERRAASDKKSGHSPACSLTKCHPNCPSAG